MTMGYNQGATNRAKKINLYLQTWIQGINIFKFAALLAREFEKLEAIII